MPGVDCLFVGPFDLGNNIGHPILNGQMHPELVNSIRRVREVAEANGKARGIYATSGEQAKEFADQGFTMVRKFRPSRAQLANCKRSLPSQIWWHYRMPYNQH